ncbi:MAG: hypothetical protein FK734_08120 [Asgard group archaeon]|nr:hypothetical protein [Asgard group archaeon]
MLRIKTLFFITVILAFNYSTLSTINISTAPSDPMRDVRPGWDVIPIYEIAHPPGPKCIGENDDLFYVDNLNYVIMKMDEFLVHTEYLTLTMPLNDIIYQPNNNRLIAVNDFAFYTITSSGITLLKNYTSTLPLTTLRVDPTDDSIYCGSIFDNSDIQKYDANGNFQSTILSNVHGCSQLVLNNNQSFLYYSETFLGSFSMLNLSNSISTVLRTNIGLLGTQEVIGIGVDDADDLYYMTADGNNRGFYRYENNSFTLLMASRAGMGTLTWSSKLHSFIVAGSAGGCLISYDPTKTSADILTPIVNSQSIIETHDNKMLLVFEDTIYQINQSGTTFFGKNPYNITIFNLLLDVDNNIFTLLGNDSVTILQVDHEGHFTDWFTNEIDEWAKSIHYDILNHNIILLTEDSLKNETNIYRIPITDPYSYTKITTIINSNKVNAVVDQSGNIFVYEGYENTLYKIPNGASEKEVITTEFVDFSDIYGTEIIVVPPLGFCNIENGILIGRNDDLQIWLLEENQRVTFALNNRGIDNSAIFQNINDDLIVTQSTIVLKFIYSEPQNTTTPTSPNSITYLPIIFPMGFSVCLYLIIKSNKRKR